MKIVVVSDSHGRDDVLKDILLKNHDADYYFHLGDSEAEINDIKPFASVRGNMDYDYNLPLERVIDLKNHSLYLTHGQMYGGNEDLIAKTAKSLGCDIAFFGHTHRFLDRIIDGVRVINPGSCRNPKDGSKPSYAVVTINDSKVIEVKRVNL